MIGATHYLQDLEAAMHVLEALLEVLTGMVIKSKVGVAVCNCRAIITKKLFLNDNAFGLELDCLQEVLELVLDVSHLGDA